MWLKEGRTPALLLLIGAYLVGSSEAVDRYIDQSSLAAIGKLMRNMRDPIEMMNLVAMRRQELGNVDDADGDHERVKMITAMDSLLELSQLGLEGRCDDEVGDLLRAFQEATAWRHSDLTSQSGTGNIEFLLHHWAKIIVNNCFQGVAERLHGARSKLHPVTVEGVEGFLTDEFLEQQPASRTGDLLDTNWNLVTYRFQGRGQSPLDFTPLCADYLQGMRNQEVLTRMVLNQRPFGHDQELFIKRTLMRINFCRLIFSSMSLYETMRDRNI